MSYSRFEAIGQYLPSAVLSTREVVERMESTPEFDLEWITGVRNRRVHGRDPETYEDSMVLALNAARDCLAKSAYEAADLDVVICGSITRFAGGGDFHFEPSMASMLCRELGSVGAIQFDVTNACAGMLTGVLILDRMIRAGVVRNGMVVSGEQATAVSETAMREISQAYDPQFASLSVGDSAAAVIMDTSPDEADRIHYIEMMTCSEHSELCVGKPSDRGAGIALYTDNRNMHKEDRVRLWPAFQKDWFAKSGRTFEDEGYDYVIHHQVGAKAVKYFSQGGAQGFGTEMPPDLNVLEELGNTATTSHFLVLHEHLRSGRLPRGSKVLIVPAASGVVAGFLSATLTSVGV